MKKYLALFLIALMAVTVVSAAGVVTTKPVAAAANPAPYVIEVGPTAPYGTKYSWTSDQMNFHYLTKSPGAASKSKGSTASVTLRYKAGDLGRAQAGVGVALQPTPMWEEMHERHVIVKVTTKTDITITGDSLVAAEAGVGTFGVWPLYQPLTHEFVMIHRDTGSDNQGEIETQTYSATQTTTIGEPDQTHPTPWLTLENVDGGICAMVLVEISPAFTTTVHEYASARVTVQSIELTLLS